MNNFIQRSTPKRAISFQFYTQNKTNGLLNINFRYAFLCIIIINVLQNQAYSQNTLDVFSLSARYTSPQNYDSVYTGKAQETGGSLALTLPVKISDQVILFNSLNYFYFHVKNDPLTGNNIAGFENLHGVILRTGLILKLKNSQTMQFFVSPRLMSDMKNSNSKNWQFGGGFIYDKHFNDNLNLGFGAIVNYECFGPYLIPVVKINYKLNEKLDIIGLLPINAKIKYQATDKFAFGLNHFGLATTFRLNEETNKDDYVERQCIDLSLFAEYELFQNVFLEARAGQTFKRFYKQYSSDQKVNFAIPLKTFGDDRLSKNIPFENSLFAELKFIYRIKIN